MKQQKSTTLYSTDKLSVQTYKDTATAMTTEHDPVLVISLYHCGRHAAAPPTTTVYCRLG